MRKTGLLLAAVLLGYFSPWIASADDGLVLWLWFNWLPTLAALWLWTESPSLATAIDVSVLAAQYLVLFYVIGRMRPLVNIATDFVRGPRHRRGLVQ